MVKKGASPPAPSIALVQTKDPEHRGKLRRLVPQKHGGALGAGGTGAGGRPPDHIRQLCKDGFMKVLPKIVAIAEGKDPDATVSDRIKATDLLGKYGPGVQSEVKGQLDIRQVSMVIRKEA